MIELFFQDDISVIFKIADKDNSGTLSIKEIQDVLGDICQRYPQVELYLKSKQMKRFVDLLNESHGNVKKESIELDIEKFKQALADVDNQVKNLPATAQVNFTFTCFRYQVTIYSLPKHPKYYKVWDSIIFV